MRRMSSLESFRLRIGLGLDSVSGASGGPRRVTTVDTTTSLGSLSGLRLSSDFLLLSIDRLGRCRFSPPPRPPLAPSEPRECWPPSSSSSVLPTCFFFKMDLIRSSEGNSTSSRLPCFFKMEKRFGLEPLLPSPPRLSGLWLPLPALLYFRFRIPCGGSGDDRLQASSSRSSRLDLLLRMDCGSGEDALESHIELFLLRRIGLIEFRSVGDGDRIRTWSGLEVAPTGAKAPAAEDVGSSATVDDDWAAAGGFFFKMPPDDGVWDCSDSLCFRIGTGLKAVLDDGVNSDFCCRSSVLFFSMGRGWARDWNGSALLPADGGGNLLSSTVSDADRFLTLGTGGACRTTGPSTTRARCNCFAGEEFTERLCCCSIARRKDSLGLGTGGGGCASN